GGLTAFLFGLLTPVPIEADDQTRVLLQNVAVFAVVMGGGLYAGNRWARRVIGGPIERWLAEKRPPTERERSLVLRQPIRVAKLAATIWGLAALVFAAVNTTVSPEVAATAGVVTLLGGAVSCTVGYLLAERIQRPLVARALAGDPLTRAVAPGVAARLTVTWLLVTGIPLIGIASMAIADLAGARLEEGTAAIATLFLAVAGLVVGFLASVIAARSVADPVQAVRDGMGRVGAGDFEARVPVDDASEIGLLEAGFNSMAAGLGERERLRDIFGRQVGHDVARAALEGELRLGGEQREVAVLFVDIVGSTTLAARRPATEVVALLNAFFALVVECVERHGGWVNKFEGDAALCVFGAPTEVDDPAGAALAAGRELRSRLVAELPDLDAGIGISAGAAVAGNIGAEQRFEYTVIGDPVNEAARLCELAKRRPERVVASEAALTRVAGGERESWALGEAVTLRGRDEPTRLATPGAR
ncbi:MAG TPA: adenylate/guanylate cyclase domain-containing protein, partial [Thermoleophilaceae bacterium]|nr:adenylate/guanylate cyclase domain-containing protein [Thermoleophilaceae bacterium]